MGINALAPQRSGINFKNVIYKCKWQIAKVVPDFCSHMELLWQNKLMRPALFVGHAMHEEQRI